MSNDITAFETTGSRYGKPAVRPRVYFTRNGTHFVVPCNSEEEKAQVIARLKVMPFVTVLVD